MEKIVAADVAGFSLYNENDLRKLTLRPYLIRMAQHYI